MSALPFDESNTFTPPSAFGPYRVLHQIGSGVLGPVFRTYDPHADRLVAVKAFRLDLLPEDVAHLADELRKLVGTAGYLAAGLEGTTAYLAMDYHAAETLDVALRHLAPAPIETALPILRAMAEAVDAAWAAGAAFGHGALHPRDVFVTPGTGELHITGFGIAPALEAIGARPPLRRPYTSPERAAGAPWDIRADVYALGAIAHELLTGRRPAGPGEQDGSLPAAMAPELRVRIRRVLSTALAESPAARFASGREFIGALEDPSAFSETAVTPTSITGFPPAADAPAPAGEPVGVEGEAGSAEPPALVPAPPPRRPRARVATPAQRSVARATSRGKGPGAGEAPLPAGDAPIDSGDILLRPEVGPDEEDVLRTASDAPLRGAAAPGALSLPPPFPWVAMAAAVLATGIICGVGGYQLGMQRAVTLVPPPTASATSTQPPAAVGSLPTSPHDTEVAVGGTAAAGEPTSGTPVPDAKPPALPGQVVVRSTPAGAAVSIDGKSVGHTPLTARDLALGTHRVVLSRAGFASEARRVALTRRAPSSTITVTLKAQRAARGETAPKAATTGAIAVDSRPRGARVTIDGRAVGVTPLSAPGLAPGAHRVRVELAGYKPVATAVTVKAGETARIAVTLEQR